jgi:site-specific recombinase XerD
MSELSEAHTRFCQEQEIFRRLSPQTIRWHRDTFRSLMRFDDSLCLSQISVDVLKNWYIHGYQKKWAPKTLINRMESLSLFFEWLIREGILQDNPVRQLARPKLPKPIPKHLSKQDAQFLIQFTRNYPFQYKFESVRAQAIIGTFLGTGLRKEELRKLEVRDVDLVNRRVFVRCGKGEKDRFVPFPPNLVSILEKYLIERRRLKRTCPFFWVSLRGDIIFSPRGVNRLIEKLKKASGLDFSAHKLRHTFAVMMLENDCDIYALSKMLGHSDIKTTTIYLRATTAHLQEQIRKNPMVF